MIEYICANPPSSVQFAEIYVYSTGVASLSVMFKNNIEPVIFGPFKNLTATKRYFTFYCRPKHSNTPINWEQINVKE